MFDFLKSQFSTNTADDSDHVNKKPCPYYANGGCKFGDSCKFAHTTQASAAGNPPYGTSFKAPPAEVCPYFMKGSYPSSFLSR